MSEDANITALEEKVRKIKNKIRFLKIIRGLMIFFIFVWFILLVIFSFSLGGVGLKEYQFMIFWIAVVPWIFVVPGRLLTYMIKKLKKQEDDSKKRLQTLLYPTPNCPNCMKPLPEGSDFCSYCGNKRTP